MRCKIREKLEMKATTYCGLAITKLQLTAVWPLKRTFPFRSRQFINCLISLLKKERICAINVQGLSAYRAVNTLHLGYKNQCFGVA